MYELITNRGDMRAELYEVIRCFVSDSEMDYIINFTYVCSDDIAVYIDINGKMYTYRYSRSLTHEKAEYTRFDNYVCKHSVYKAMCEYTGKSLPWGSLTGIRPTRIAARMSANGLSESGIKEKMCSDYGVSPDKAELTCKILQTQSAHIGDRLSSAGSGCGKEDELVNLYVHIPFCPTRCSYCSFVSEGIETKGRLIPSYADSLIEEINLTKNLISEQGKKIFSVYIGGGTPTVLSPSFLEKVLRAAAVENVEYTCEAGRPDTIDDEKLKILYDCGVNRISINPQTLHNKTLQKIGRNHTAECFFEAYGKAQKYGFVKNVDLIAGLDGETPEDFKVSLDGIIKLSPENITVHTLCVKRGSSDSRAERLQTGRTEEMVNYSVKALYAAGYLPYYLYRQKQMSGNLENIGWCKPSFICVNNVTVMEEILSVYACGAGAISKCIVSGRIQRLANPKDVLLYLSQFEERMNKKQLFYQNQFTTGS